MTVIFARLPRFRTLVMATLAMSTVNLVLAQSVAAPQSPSFPTSLPKPSAAVLGSTNLLPTPATSAPDVAPVITPKPADKFDVELTDGRMTVNATNASLDKVLHEVARKAGVKVTGGLSDERVFGHYGPAAPSVILATLLDGTGTNMLIVDDANGGSELVLTQRLGGASAPVAAAETASDDPDNRTTPRYVPPLRPFQPPRPGRGPLTIPPNFGPGAQNATPQFPASVDLPQPTEDQSTSQQVYEQLRNAAQPK